MLLYVFSKDEMTILRLPAIINGNYWLKNKNPNGEYNNLINIEAKDNKWMMKSNEDASISFNGNPVTSIFVAVYNVYVVKTATEFLFIYAVPSNSMFLNKYNITKQSQILIGKANNCDILYQDGLIADNHAKIVFNQGSWVIDNIDERFGTYVNNVRIKSKVLKPGDIINILGLKIVWMNSFIAINNPRGAIRLNGNIFALRVDNVEINSEIKENIYLELYNDEDYFEKSPRFITKFERQTVKIDDPPQKNDDDEQPLLLTLGPMLSMGMVSVIMVWTSIDSVINDGRSVSSVIPSIIMSIAMLLTILLWPSLTARYEKKKRIKREQLRQEEYRKYLRVKNNEIEILLNQQRQILIDNNVSLEDCQNIILNKKRNLWEREIDHEDFLSVRLGIGTIKPDIDIQYPEEHFSLIQDNLKEILENTVSRNKTVNNVPVKISLAEKNKTVIIGDRTLVNPFLESLFIQLMTFHSYHDLKIVFLSSSNDNNFDYLRKSPYTFSNNNETRFYGTNIEENKQICNYLLQVFNMRKYKDENQISEDDYRKFPNYYLIIVNDIKAIKNIGLINEILESPINYGFTILLCYNSISNLPNEFSSFININGDYGKTSGYFENELTSDKQQMFVADLNIQKRVNLELCVKKLSSIPLKNIGGKNFELPNTLSFLEMYNIGNVEQLNSRYRWQTNDPTISLKVPVGIDEFGESFNLDLHEKAHGPHGLIAGMTGSGKSEFIITYILSLAVNYHPNEVSFVLIDYKGGGLAGAFENRETGLKLPHLAGTITNLDIADMNRALASIQSELRRRQKIFNEARELVGESTIDIYKYQRLYREGKVNTPVSHLFVISDEFAELKDQQPDFMDQLISAARIGRSLGVHLILSTQKPSGVVNDQIWSNSKFRVCLKVQDKSDSMDMIKTPLAALIKDVGRFYLQVGYNEYFALGQSAWSGGPYFPQEKRQKKVNTSLDFIDNTGTVIKSITQEEDKRIIRSQGEELNNILSYLINIANEQSIKVDKLWLEKLPAEIIVDNLKKKYAYKAIPNIINPIIGEYDDPNNQKQGLLTLPLSKKGNSIIYGIGGSGKEELLTTLIYSTISEHSVNEVNFYILDFGSEILNVFKKAPHIGDIAISEDKEKIENLFKQLDNIIEERKDILNEYNGDFNLYNQKNEIPLPTIVLVINNYDGFAETYEDLDDSLIALTRDCIRYGIVVVLTVSTINSVRYRLSQNFGQFITLQLSDPYDYINIVGRTNGLVPASILGRGLVKLDDIYEFQTAYAFNKEEVASYLQNFCSELSNKTQNRAPSIPILPEKVTVDLLKDKLGVSLSVPIGTISNIPIGIYKDSLGVVKYNFKNKFITLITGNYDELLVQFLNPLIDIFTELSNIKLVVISPDESINSSNEIYTGDYNELIDNLNNYNENIVKTYNENKDINSLNNYEDMVCIIHGIDNFFKELSTENQEKFEKILNEQVKLKKIIFIIVDTVDEIKTQEYNSWYKTINLKNGIWLGPGLYEQYLLEANVALKETNEALQNSFGFIINKSQARLAKLLEEENDD
ncbi:MAG: type VII secretion protein EssC [Bacilli bacterium]|nr:type VII secretion protein EssC [Bacilli bacterium]